MQPAILEVDELMMGFGGLLAVDGVSFKVKSQQILSLIGPNGAGKTTIFNCLTGFYRPTAGTVLLRGKKINGLRGYEVARRGMVRTFQNVRLFSDMSVIENLLIAQHRHLNTGYLAGLFKTKSYVASEKKALETSAFWLDKAGLLSVANRVAGTLAYGQQRRLEIIRAMMTQPSLLMLDEPAAGLNPQETEELKALISHLKTDYGLTVLLIEHDMKLVMTISDYIVVLNQGRLLAQGEPQVVRHHPEVIKAYLGET